MKNKIKKTGGYLIYIIISNALYGILLYFMVTWLLKYSELYAYLGNLTFIIIGLLLDEYIIRKAFQPNELSKEIQKMKKEEDRDLNRRLIKGVLSNFVSFKTSLFFFYIFVLLFSQILNFKPELVSPEINSFIHLIDYSVIILLAFKDFGEEFSKDRSRMKKTLEEFEEICSK